MVRVIIQGKPRRGAHTVSEALKTNPAVATLMEPSGYSTARWVSCQANR